MPRYFSIHRAPGLSQEDFATNAADVVNGKHAIHVHTYANLIDGTLVNIFEAESEDELIREFERLGWPYEEIHELELSVDAAGLRAMVEKGS